MKSVFSFLLGVFAIGNAVAQGDFHCGADELRINTLQKNPAIADAVNRREAILEAHTQNYIQQDNRGGSGPYIIPVVFHVIHNFGPENISDAQIHDAIRVVNRNYRKLNADTVDIIQPYKALAADCNIELRLAQKDPNGNCTRGINRIVSNTTFTGGHEVKQLIQWDPTKYLNVYIVSNAAGLAGHAVWPADADTIPEWDGIVISHDYVGSTGTSNAVRSVVLSHELGHYLNLHHIWGGNNVPGFYYLPVGQAGNCAYDDLVSDTPNTIGWNTCNLNHTSCGNTQADNVQNFMDYAYCARMLTHGQAARMHACLNSPIAGRNNLWSPANLIATGTDGNSVLCQADFSADKRLICAGETITFYDNSYHGVSSRTWNFPGGTASSLSDSVVTVSYPSAGNYTVSLSVGNGSTSTSSSVSNYITVMQNPGIPGQIIEHFEGITGLPNSDWHPMDPQGDGGFELTTNTGYLSSTCVKVNNYTLNEGYVDELILSPRNISGFPSIQISFMFAFTQKDSAFVNDKLRVYVSNDCGANWALRRTLAASSMITAPFTSLPFIPGDETQWMLNSITNIPNSFITDDFMVKFTWESDGGNNFYLDNINIAANLSVEEKENKISAVLYPQPNNGSFAIEWNTLNFNKGNLEIYSATGQKIGEQHIQSGNSRAEVQRSDLAKGYYFVRLNLDENQLVLPLIISE